MHKIGDPLDDGVLYGPMHSQVGIDGYLATLKEVKELGGTIEYGGNVIERDGYYVEPTIVSGLPHDSPVIHRETFAPIVYMIKTSSFEQGIEYNNEVKQGLSASLFTQDLGHVFQVNFYRTIHQRKT